MPIVARDGTILIVTEEELSQPTADTPAEPSEDGRRHQDRLRAEQSWRGPLSSELKE
jgi:hypothetical protein